VKPLLDFADSLQRLSPLVRGVSRVLLCDSQENQALQERSGPIEQLEGRDPKLVDGSAPKLLSQSRFSLFQSEKAGAAVLLRQAQAAGEEQQRRRQGG
jgi:hypothetical protein